MKKIINLSSIRYNKQLLDFYINHIYKSIIDLNEDYPNFDKWYFSKVSNGLILGERDIIVVEIDKKIAGIAILKDTLSEKKICTLRVTKEYRKVGIGSILVRESQKILEIDRPMITVSQDKYEQFKKLFRKNGFKLDNVLDGFYKKDKSELIFNL